MIVWTIIFILFGLALLVGGTQLVLLGGSWYYLLAGATMVVVALLIKLRRPFAQCLYALLLLATAAWAFWEVGFDWWPLASRLGVLLLLAIPLLFPGRGNHAGARRLLRLSGSGSGCFPWPAFPTMPTGLKASSLPNRSSATPAWVMCRRVTG